MRLRRQVGRRGYFLITLAVVDFFYGYNVIRPETVGRRQQNEWIAQVTPVLGSKSMVVWWLLWWSAGVACLVSAFLKDDMFGYGAAFSIKVAWVAVTALAGMNGMPGAITSCIVWGWFASCVLMVAKWAEPRMTFAEVAREISESGEIPRIDRGNVAEG